MLKDIYETRYGNPLVTGASQVFASSDDFWYQNTAVVLPGTRVCLFGFQLWYADRDLEFSSLEFYLKTVTSSGAYASGTGWGPIKAFFNVWSVQDTYSQLQKWAPGLPLDGVYLPNGQSFNTMFLQSEGNWHANGPTADAPLGNNALVYNLDTLQNISAGTYFYVDKLELNP